MCVSYIYVNIWGEWHVCVSYTYMDTGLYICGVRSMCVYPPTDGGDLT